MSDLTPSKVTGWKGLRAALAKFGVERSERILIQESRRNSGLPVRRIENATVGAGNPVHFLAEDIDAWVAHLAKTPLGALDDGGALQVAEAPEEEDEPQVPEIPRLFPLRVYVAMKSSDALGRVAVARSRGTGGIYLTTKRADIEAWKPWVWSAPDRLIVRWLDGEIVPVGEWGGLVRATSLYAAFMLESGVLRWLYLDGADGILLGLVAPRTPVVFEGSLPTATNVLREVCAKHPQGLIVEWARSRVVERSTVRE